MYRGGSEQKIRQYLIDNNYVDTVIQLPPNLFFGVTIAPCILVLKKSRAEKNVLFINAQREFVRFGNKNKLRLEDIQKIISWIEERRDVDYCAKLVSNEELKENKYLLSVTAYVKAENTRESIDIQNLNKSIYEIVLKQTKLRKSVDSFIEEIEGA